MILHNLHECHVENPPPIEDGCPAYYSRLVRDHLNEEYPDRWIGRADQPVTEQPSTGENQSLEDRTSSNVEVIGPSQLESPSRSQISGTVNVTPDVVRPYPKAGPRKLQGMKRKKGKTRILTDTPEKRLIEMEEEERQRKNKIKELNKNRKCFKNTGQKTVPKLADEFTSKPEKNRKFSSDDEIENVSVSDETVVELEEDFDEDDVIVLDRNFQINNFVLVKFDTKKTVYHYVGIIEDVNQTMATVKFMRRISREREKHARNVNVEAISQVLALFSTFCRFFWRETKERENVRTGENVY
ncbi:uncharacterized protein LOC125072196 [Vanessa atalanta]|uniref:uncharacterized protein LOC125072196 n=1 Tax=Vanessa atalanta TaxID=42275 RepID=UPI001FCDCC0B|nr:uncharacterized protein LOC125072196 [Vanessa atalanta]